MPRSAALHSVVSPPQPPASPQADRAGLRGGGMRAFLILGAAVFAASMLGLASHYTISVAFWPANAVLVGLTLRDRRLHRLAGWLGAALEAIYRRISSSGAP